MPRVSAIVIFLNAEAFIREAIESVLSQSYSDWDLWLVDDGSSDGSTEIAREHERAHPDTVHYLEHPGHENKGMSASRNLGLSHATGEYVAFLDADDVWLPRKLEEQVAILDAHPNAGMVFGAAEVWHAWTDHPDDAGRDYTWRFFGVPPDSLVKPPTLIPLILRYRSSPCPSVVVVRRAAAMRTGGFEPAFRTMYEDEVFYSKLCLQEPVFVSSRCWIRRRQHPDACTSQSDRKGESRGHRLTYLTWLERYLAEQRAQGTDAWKALQEQLMTYRPGHRQPWTLRLSARLAAARDRLWWPMRRAACLAFGRSTGAVSAAPNPIHLSRTGVAIVKLAWTSSKTKNVELRLGAPDGQLISRSGPRGGTATGDWVNNGMLFYLQDVSDGKPLSPAHTLDRLKVSVLP